MCGVTLWDRVRNKEIRERAGVQVALSDRADQNVLKWFRHGKDVGGEIGVKKIYRSYSVAVRPKNRWKDGVKRALENRGSTVNEGSARAGDRVKWSGGMSCMVGSRTA